jgi:hypothetical protein
MALNCYEITPWDKMLENQGQWFTKCLFFVALATVIRPTTVLLWLPLCLLHLFEQWEELYKINHLMAEYIIRFFLIENI